MTTQPTSQNGSDFPSQIVALGDMVYFYDHPMAPSDPVIGWVSRRPGVNTVCVLTFSPDSGFVEKLSVRHIDDPGLQDNRAWAANGGWEFAPATKMLKRLETIVPQVVTVLSREQPTKKK
jgi:hypothetical protein